MKIGAFSLSRILAIAGVVVAISALVACGQEVAIEPTAEMVGQALTAARGGRMPEIEQWQLAETSRGVRFVEAVEGAGDQAFYGDDARVHYYIWIPDGTLVDSTRPEGIPTPEEFELGGRRTIVGWDEILLQLQEGSEALAVIPWELAYGRNGRGAVPGRTDLIVYVSLLRVQ